jgi:hypothetical protein
MQRQRGELFLLRDEENVGGYHDSGGPQLEDLCDGRLLAMWSDERDAVLHQPADVVHVAGQPIELGDQDRRFSRRAKSRAFASSGRCSSLRPPDIVSLNVSIGGNWRRSSTGR